LGLGPSTAIGGVVVPASISIVVVPGMLQARPATGTQASARLIRVGGVLRINPLLPADMLF